MTTPEELTINPTRINDHVSVAMLFDSPVIAVRVEGDNWQTQRLTPADAKKLADELRRMVFGQ